MIDALTGAASTLGGAARTSSPKPKIWGAVIGAVGGMLSGASSSRAQEKQNAAQIESQERMARENREFEERMRKEDIQRKKDAVGKYKGYFNGGNGSPVAKPKPIAAGLSARGGGDVIGRDPERFSESVGSGGGGMGNMHAELLGMQRRR